MQSGPSQRASQEMAAILLAESYVVWSAGQNNQGEGKEDDAVVGFVVLTWDECWRKRNVARRAQIST